MTVFNLPDGDRDEFRNLLVNLDFALRHMSCNQKLALFLHYWQRKTVREVANTFAISWDKADRLIDESLAELRQQLFIADDIKQAEGF